ncbi:MAG: NAD(P)/FAD-dependent oxidoreductase [Acidimicrobiia bacterium]|nr:NAD(P)/FAD-dependent oxidoreductase [Acidimicrobiia bacterium]
MSEQRHVEVVVVGAGFAGMYLIYRMRRAGRSVQGFETAGDVGGTWYWNRYPGARCDVESMEYSYDFDEDLQQEWTWTEKYSTQPEILRYAQHVADRFELRPHIRFNTRVEAAYYDEGTGRWLVRTDDGDELTCQFFVMATGCLSSANLPDIEGRDSFGGVLAHTGRWPHDGVDVTGKRVGIIGTGSSGIQAIPVLAAQAGHLTVFQRTAQFTLPARNGPLDPAEQDRIKETYAELRAANRKMPGAFGSRYARRKGNALDATPERLRAEFDFLWEQGGPLFLASFRDLMLDPEANRLAADFVREKIAEIVDDPETAARLTPHGLIGCKRLVIDTDYYETYNRPNVMLVDVGSRGDPIQRITPTGVLVGPDGTEGEGGEHHELDVLIFATGFDAMTGSLLRVDIRGRGGRALADKWANGPVTYLGLNVVGFPNLFTVTGPGSPSVLANMIVATEQHVDWISECIEHLDANGLTTIEATPEAEAEWVAHVNAIADRTIFPTCNSWYVGANIPGKPRVFMPLPGFPNYVKRCEEVVAGGYEGFVLS